MKKLIALLLALTMVFALCACSPTTQTGPGPASNPGSTSSDSGGENPSGGSQYTETYNWNVAITFGGDSIRNIQAMLDEVTEKTNGRMQFTVYPSNSLISIPEYPDALKDSICDIGVVASINYPSIFTYNAEIVGMPFTGMKDEYQAIEAWYALREQFPDEINGEWESVGAFPWYVYTTPGYHLLTINSSNEIRKPEDLAGHKIMSGKTQILNLINAYGGAAIQAAPTVYYENLEKAVAEGVVNNYGVCNTFGALELMKSSTEFGTGAYYDMFFIAISQKSWDKLDPEVQQAFLDVNADMRADMLEQKRSLEDNANAIAALSDDFNKTVLSDEELQVWIDAMEPYNEAALEEMTTTYQKDKATEMYNYLLDWIADQNN